MAKRLYSKKVSTPHKASSQARQELTKDIFLILLGACIAIILSRFGLLDDFIALFGNPIMASFIAGIFFTSIFTITPASIILVQLIEHAPFNTIALWGALGAVCGDLILFFFIRDRFADDLINSMQPSFTKHIFASFHLGFMKWLAPIIGALIIASPLPDEFGLALLGMSRVRTGLLVPLSFAMNWLGIYSIVWFGSVV